MKKTFHKQPKLLIKELLKLERCGKYDEAIAQLQDIWEDTTELPNVDEFESRIGAEIFLRCGSLIGFLGHNKQLPNSQEKSKNLLTEAHRRFLDIYDIEKIAECENYLALAYWRTGELVEAETWIEESLQKDLAFSNPIKLYSYVIKSMIFLFTERFQEVSQNFNRLEECFVNYADDFLKGNFYNNYGLALKNLGNTAKALDFLELGKKHFLRSGNRFHFGLATNNLAQLHKSERNFAEAHQAIDNATEIFRQINDRTREGFSFDTKAQIYFAEGRFAEALETIETAIEILERSENSAYLVETYLTKVKILISSDDISAATLCLFDAVQFAKTRISEEAAKKLVKEFEVAIRQKTSPVISNVFTEKELISGNLELLLPPSIAHYKEYQAVRIKNRHLEKVGLRPDSLAIVVNEKVKRGDLVVISEIKDGSVMCGFYDADFGIVCLEGIDSEPQLRNESEIKILGKVIGVCDAEKNSDGKLEVRPI